MPAINFKKQVAVLVESGEKRQTIRARRKKGHIKIGDTLYFKTGMRTSNCKAIGESECKKVTSICINGYSDVVLGADPLSFQDIDKLATKDGFKGRCEFIEYFDKTYGIPFHGVLIEW